MKFHRLVLVAGLLATAVLLLLPIGLEAKEETLLILTSSDTQAEIAPCG
ncbi:MAG: hypothetical protein V2A71_02935 [Candidatus Eisenbacteria bacterium]